MLFNVAGLLASEVGASRHYDLDPEEPIHRGHVELIRTPGGVLVRCDAIAFQDATCSRCLAPFSYPETLMFEEIFVQQVDPATGRKFANDDPDAFVIAMDNTIDIKEAVRQYIEMAAEMQPLCRPDCPGICPVCGTDLGIADCQCDRTPIDPRWLALETLKRTKNG